MFDLGAVSFYGALQPLRSCESVSATTGAPGELRSIRPDVHAYLRRVDFFTSAPGSAVTFDSFDPKDDLLRSPSSTNVFELHPIATDKDVNKAITTPQRILGYWLSQLVKDGGSVMNLISEACRNIVLRSGSTGWMLAQKYERQRVVLSWRSVMVGGAFRDHYKPPYGAIAQMDSGFIVRALHGLSSVRVNGTSVGLPTMRSTTEDNGGYLFIRSGQGRVNARGGRLEKLDQLTPLPGTQIAMCFQASP